MKSPIAVWLFALCASSTTGLAAPVEYDSPEYHLVVCRPFDSWSGDTKVMDGERDTIASYRGRVSYRVSATTSTVRGAGLTLLNGPSDDAITTDTIALMKSRGVAVSSLGSYHWQMGAATELEPGNYALMRQAQSAIYEALIRKQGDPEKIPGSTSARRVLGNVLAFSAIGLGMGKFGALGGSVVATTFAGDISQLPVGVRQSIAPFDLPDLDATGFTTLEVFPVKVNEGGSPGQVIVAYKAVPTDATRHDALVQALASLAGSDTSPDAIDAARALDLQHRREVWNTCVSASTCGTPNDAHEETKK